MTRGLFPAPRKRLGQHFLSDPRILDRIADALGPGQDDIVVEIGAGRGALTERLATRAKQVIAIELDGTLAALLRERFSSDPQVSIVERDVLSVSFGELAGANYLLAGNVPYYITTPILFQALQAPMPRRAVYLVQLEVAERLTATPGTKAYGALTVNVQNVATTELLFRVPPGAFAPPPAVQSAVIRIQPRADAVMADVAGMRTLVQGAFGMRRKQLRRVLRSIAMLTVEEADRVLDRAGLDPECRPETLTANDFARLHQVLAEAGTPVVRATEVPSGNRVRHP